MPRKVSLRRFHRGEVLLLTAKLHDRKLPIWIAQRYRIIALVRLKQSVFAAARQLGCAKDTAYRTVQEFHRFGLRRFERISNPEGRPSRITRAQLRALIRVAQKRPTDVGLPFTHWSMTILQDYLVKRLRFPKVSPEWLRRLLHREGVSWQHTKTWKQSHDPDFERKKSVFWPFMPSVRSAGRSSVTINSARWNSAP
jgi:transposase